MTREPDSRAGWALLRGELAARRPALVRVGLWSLLEGLPALLSGRLVAAALDEGFLRGRPGIGVACLVALVVAGGLGALATRGMFPWLGATVEPLRDALVRGLVGGTLSDAVHGGARPDTSAVARLTGQVETVRGLVGAALRSLRRTAVTLLATLVGLLTLAPAVVALVLPPLLLAGLLFALTLRGLAARRREAVVLEERIAQEVGPVLGGLRDVVACGAERQAATAVGTVIDRQAEAAVRLARAGTLRTLVVLLGGQLPLLAVLAAGPWLVGGGRLTGGQLIGAVTYVTANLLPALRALVGLVATWGIQLGTVLSRLALAGTVPVPAAGVAAPPVGAPLATTGLTFSYGPWSEPVLAGLDLEIADGDHLAVVGPSGAGKSTLARLLTGGLAPTGGRVTLGGIPVDRVDPAHLHRQVALIPQEAYVFAGTVRENLGYLRPDADDALLDRTVEELGLRPLIERLGGLDGEIGPGGEELSSGERQLIALARVHASEARIVVLDEATCHLDPRAESRAEAAFLRRGGALVVIAHRISSAERARRVLLLDGAKAVVAPPRLLPGLSPLYARLLGHWHQGGPEGSGGPGPGARTHEEVGAGAS
ncbi:ABC transporter ATP-binding protein [Kitasatospora sp. NPDC051853]|uniref:ABC transporter ATP-binding protein n=1 Tax=Kitasatospora sp. NPDC051853 TaxID=3364058 RepID=UPI0037BA61C5